MLYLSKFNPLFQALFAGIFTFILTVLGSAVVFLFRKTNKTMMDGMLATSSGIMLSASFFSLIIPAIESISIFKLSAILTFISFISGSLFLYFNNWFLEKFISGNKYSLNKRNILLFLSITMHNIPEGLVLGVAFGSAYYGSSTLAAAVLLTIGIAIQNFPEGSAISLPLKRDGLSNFKSFIFGALSGVVEPIAAVIGALLVLNIKTVLPLIMLFTAGAMIYVTIVELIPESQKNKKEGLMALLNILGFSFMMILELLL